MLKAAISLALAASVLSAQQQTGQQTLSASAGAPRLLDAAEEAAGEAAAAALLPLRSQQRAMAHEDAAIAEEEAFDEELNSSRDILFIETLLRETGAESLLDGGSTGTSLDVGGNLTSGADGAGAFIELGVAATAGVDAEVEKVHGYCEICTRMLQMYQRGLPDLCSGLTDTFFITCVKNMESMLKADRAVVYWHQVGCVHLDDGPEIVKPCPAHTICGWVPNIFARRVGITQSIGQLAPLCPRDINYLPRVPRTLAPGGLPGS